MRLILSLLFNIMGPDNDFTIDNDFNKQIIIVNFSFLSRSPTSTTPCLNSRSPGPLRQPWTPATISHCRVRAHSTTVLPTMKTSCHSARGTSCVCWPRVQRMITGWRGCWKPTPAGGGCSLLVLYKCYHRETLRLMSPGENSIYFWGFKSRWTRRS